MPEAALDNWQPIWNAEVSISTPVCVNFELALVIYIFVGLILMFWHRETYVNPQRNRPIIVDPAAIELTTSRLRQHSQLPVVQHIRFMPLKWCQKHNPNDRRTHIPKLYIYIYIYIHTYLPVYIYTYINLCRILDSDQGLWNQISRNARWQTDCPIEDRAKNLKSIARPYDQRVFVVKFEYSGTGKRFSNRKETSCLLLLKYGLCIETETGK